MSGADSRIVTMKFDNKTFEQGASTTMSTLAKLKASLNFTGASKGLNEVQAAGSKFNLAPMEGAVTSVNKAWLAMATVAITAISQITMKAMAAGGQLVKSLTIDPIKSGLAEYETNLNAIQTILANTGLEGEEGLGKVNKALTDLNVYSDKTIYNFSQMAKNIGTFTAAGVDLDTSTAAIKGIANLAAVSGSNADQASTAMYQLSQALSTGRVSLMDWNSVVNAGMGGKVFQKSLMETARNHGIAVDDIIKKEGSFRDSLQTGWLTSKVLTETLGKFTGDLNAKQLKTMGYNDKQIEGILKMGKVAQDAATKVKTMSQLVGTLQESAGSGWSATWQLVFGDFDEAKELFTNVNNVLGGMIGASADARNKVLGDWKKMGGRTVAIEAISNAFHAVMDIIKPIKEAFREIFPAKTGEDLYNITVAIRDFTEGLKISDETSDNLKRTFKGVFAIFSIGAQIIKAIFGMFKDLFGVVSEGEGSFLGFTGGIGDFLVKIDDALKKGELLETFFGNLSGILAVPIRLIKAIAGFISDIFAGFDTKAADDMAAAFGNAVDRMTPFERLGQRIADMFGGMVRLFSKAGELLQPAIDVIVEGFSKFGDAIAKGMGEGTFDGVLDLLNTLLLGGIVLIVRKFLKNPIAIDVGGGMFGQIREMFGILTGSMKAMQTQIKAKTLLMIAGAIALLTVSVVALSLIDSDKLTKALTAMAIGFGQLLGAMAVLVQVSGHAGFIKIPMLAASMVLLATSLVIMAAAIKIMSTMSWEELAKGLTGTAGALVIIALAMKLMPNNLPLTASGLWLVGAGLAVIAGAMKLLGMLSWEEIGKGLVAMAGALVVIGLAMQLMPLSLPITAAGLILVGVGLTAIAGVMKLMGMLDWEEIGKGLVGIAGALVLIALGMNMMPLTLPITAAGLILVGIALAEIAGVAKILATMSWKDLGKAAAALAGMMLIIAGGLTLMTGTLMGSAALIVAAGALAILAPVMVVLGGLSWTEIAKGLVAMAGAFVVLGLAGLILGPLTPIIIGLGLGMALFGAGLALAGAGALAFAAAFAIFTAVGAAGIAVLGALIAVVIAAIPELLESFANGLIAFAQIIATGGPAFKAAFVTILTSMLDAIIVIVPKIGKALTVLIGTAIKILKDNVPRLVQAGFNLLLGLLRGIANNIGKIVKVVADIIVRFIRALGDQQPRIVDAAAKMIIKFINGLSAAIDNNSEAMGRAGGRLAVSIIKGIAVGISSGVGQIKDAAISAAKGALDAAIDFLKPGSPYSTVFRDEVGKRMSAGIAVGITALEPAVANAAVDVGEIALITLKDAMSRIPDALSGEVDMNPVIAPILDLTQLEQDAARINGMLLANTLAATVSYDQASSISMDREAERIANDTASIETPSTVVQLEQNNYSPKALSSVEIYRQTKNQLSLAKEALKS